MRSLEKAEKWMMLLAAISAGVGIFMAIGNPNADLGYRLLTLVWIGVAYLKTIQIQKLEGKW